MGDLGRWFARRLVRFYYPRIEAEGVENIPESAQILFVANHANSVIDPVVIGIATGKQVRYLAKAPLFDTPVFGRLLHAMGMIPAFRGSDDTSQVKRNLESLDVAAAQLAEGRNVGIFPEGKSHDEAHVEQVRSGAARIAVKAAAGGADKLAVIPIGLNYQDKERFRSSVWVRVGEPIDVNAKLAQHDGAERKAMRELTGEIDAGLKRVVIHLDDPKWAWGLTDLETIGPDNDPAALDPISALRERKRLADAVNWHMQKDPERTREAARRIAAHRERLKESGLALRSPMVRARSPRAFLFLLRQTIWLCAGMIPWLGTVHHLPPFLLVRGAAGRLNTQGRPTVALFRLSIGLPVYLAWYALVLWCMSRYFLAWIAIAWCALMPFAGLWALDYWRRARSTAALWWSETRILFNRDQLKELRAERRELVETLEEMSAEHRRAEGVSPQSRRPPAFWPIARRIAKWTAAAVAAVLAFALVDSWFRQKTIDALEQASPTLTHVPKSTLEASVERDGKALIATLEQLDAIRAESARLMKDFESGERDFFSQEDNDAIRRTMRGYLSCRRALLGIIWRHRNFHEIQDPDTRLRTLLVALTAASSLYESSMVFVTDFLDSPDAVKKLNEPEPLWDIPAGVFDRIHGNLLNEDYRSQLEAALAEFRARHDEFDRIEVWSDAVKDAWRDRIEKAMQTIESRQDRLGGGTFEFAVDGALAMGRESWYEAQAFVSFWIGKARVRAPREGQTLITSDKLEALRKKLKPGDILIERRNWVLSNAFLPGYWPHAALYVGTARDHAQTGLHRHPEISPKLSQFGGTDAEGHLFSIIEALAAGVIFNTLEHSVGGADSVCVFRPRVSQEKLHESIGRAFSHQGKPYDFDFDFFSTDKLVCTELVYRAYDGEIDFPLVDVMGRKTMPAMELIRKWERERGTPGAQLDFVAFLDGDESTGTSAFRTEEALIESLDRSSFTWLQAGAPPP